MEDTVQDCEIFVGKMSEIRTQLKAWLMENGAKRIISSNTVKDDTYGERSFVTLIIYEY